MKTYLREMEDVNTSISHKQAYTIITKQRTIYRLIDLIPDDPDTIYYTVHYKYTL